MAVGGVLSNVERKPGISSPFTGKTGKNKNPGGSTKAKQQQPRHRLQPTPLWQRFLPLIVSGASLQCARFFFADSAPRGDEVLFASLCFLGGVVTVEACRRVVATFGDAHLSSAHAAVAHFSGNASGYVASFVLVVILQGVWDEGHENEQREAAQKEVEGFPRKFYRSCLSCLAVLSLGAALQCIAPRLGEFLLRQLDDVRLSRRGSVDRRCERWGWKTAKECLATSVVFGLCITAAVVSGGGALLLGLGMTHSIVSAGREAVPVIRKGWLRRRMSRGKNASSAGAAAAAESPAQGLSLRGVLASIRSGPTRVVCSPVVLPTFALWMTYSTICSWPKECTERLAFLLEVLAATVCTMHLARSPAAAVAAAAAAAENDLRSSSIQHGNEALVVAEGGSAAVVATWIGRALVCACSVAAWAFLLQCCLVVFGRRASSEGILVAVLVVTAVALRSPHEKSWRGLMLAFWVALLAVLLNAAALKLLQQNKVFHRVFSGEGGGGSRAPSYLGILRATAQLREERHVAMWTVCPSSVVENAPARPWFG
ncbi:unnamed protein product [Ectocarpus fasciculatus]